MSQNDQRSSESNGSGEIYYYLSRNVPHPRMVCHMQGLNNAPVCLVRSILSGQHPDAADTVTPQQEADQEHHVRTATGNGRRNASATHHLPSLEAFLQREPGTSQPTAQGHADVPEKIQSKPTTPEKLLKKQSQASTPSSTRQGARSVSVTPPSSPSVNLRPGAHVQNMNVDLGYLDQDMKVLEKLGQVLQTDSVTQIQKWFETASIEEKGFVYRLIFSKPTDKGVLNSKEGPAENMNTQTLLQPHPLPRRGPEGDMNQSRSSSRSSVASQNINQESNKERLLLSRLRNTSPAEADTLLPGKNCN
ncbi:PREDICTED: uncharacterized protein C4orf17 homolog [Calidris pugnax]|uniref:uncharacterized protein C4orf17 homolog n=1 Tax=Calidris pugnax TaxID=198806 RepID=UPI00071D764E|nr:PREDICTED: uncharacterized protein C4orf17 homolog [Calidris pugnax]XP_014796559.1 PREDICTED: uncharacterized protein C4orf17 homolog [Calidris pugnax]XP_014796568.1 PREDICTED: uncharacterized protein C4orf17 homolog [Calidris pugnax]